VQWMLNSQIEYMVVSFDDEKKRALLSLRQTEILMKLQSVTLDPGLEKYKPKKWQVTTPRLPSRSTHYPMFCSCTTMSAIALPQTDEVVTRSQVSTPNTEGTCSNPPQVVRIPET
jgi:hypothetical protein